MLQHPFVWLTPSQQKKTFIILTFCTMVLMAVLTIPGAPLKTEHAPLGIVSFEFAKTLSQAQQMMSEWGPKGKIYAAFNLGLDYLFLVLYPSSIALGCTLIADRTVYGQALFSAVGILLSWAQIGSAGLDAVENAALMNLLLGAQWSAWPGLAWWCALLKFIIVLAGLVYIVSGTAFILIQKFFTNR